MSETTALHSVPAQAASGEATAQDQEQEAQDLKPTLDPEKEKAWKALKRAKRESERLRKEYEAATPEERDAFEAAFQEQQQAEADKELSKQSEQLHPLMFAPEYPYSDKFGLPDETQTPESYKVTRAGVHVLQTFGAVPQWTQIAFGPVVITGTFSDSEGNGSVELAWTHRGQVVKRVVSAGLIKRGRELVKELGSVGLPVIDSDSRQVERWLANFELTNAGVIPHSYLARWLGWQPDGSFICSPEDGARVEMPYPEYQHGPANAHRRSGTFEAWQEGMKECEHLIVPRASLAASFGASLLRLLDVTSFTVDNASRSTQGKTTAGQMLLSVWADPSENGHAIKTWRTSLLSLEMRLNVTRGIPTMLDESMTAESEKIISDVLYDLPKNMGKGRGGGWASNLGWETILYVTGERPLLSYVTHQGVSGRVLTMTQSPFGKNGGPTAVKVRDCFLENYGHAGPMFIRHLQQKLQEKGGRDELKNRHRELTEQLRGDNVLAARRAPMVAVLALAEELACKWGVLPYEALPLSTWQETFTANTNLTDDRPEMAMDVLRSYVATHADHVYRSDGLQGQIQPHSGWLGILIKNGKEKNAPRQIAISPSKAREILDREGYSLDAVLESWIESGYLELSQSQKPPHLLKKRLNGAQSKFLVFTTTAIDFSSGDGETEKAEQG